MLGCFNLHWQCWIDGKYAPLRLWLHYFWIFVAMFGTIATYAIIYVTLRVRLHGKLRRLTVTSLSTNLSDGQTPDSLRRGARYMILYPAIYVVCTLPLAAARMAAMSNITISLGYYCFAGAASTSCGWLDVILYACTRRKLIFSDKPPPPERYGLDTFGMLDDDSGFCGTVTEISAPLTKTPVKGYRLGGIVSGLHHGKKTPKTRYRQDSGDEQLASPIGGVVTTKTTIEVRDHETQGKISNGDSGIEIQTETSDSGSMQTVRHHRKSSQDDDDVFV